MIAGELKSWVRQSQQNLKEEPSPARKLQVLKASKKSPTRESRSRSLSNEGNAFVRRIDNLRTNIEIGGKALQGYYKKSEAENLLTKKQSER